jgi:hypothetical protein
MTDVGGMVWPACMLYGCDVSDTYALFLGCWYSRCLDSCTVEGA